MDWVQTFKDYESSLEHQLNLDFSSQQPLPRHDIHEMSLTPFEHFQGQPSIIKDFLSRITTEFETIGNVISYYIEEELQLKSCNDLKTMNKIYKSESVQYISHSKQMLEIVMTKFLEAIKVKITENATGDFLFETLSEDTCLLYLNVLNRFEETVNIRILNISQLFQAKIAQGVYWKQSISSEGIVDKCKGFSLESSSTKAKLIFNEC